MKESYGEGLATHTGPESCGVVREDGVEASTGERAGRVDPRVARERWTRGPRREGGRRTDAGRPAEEAVEGRGRTLETNLQRLSDRLKRGANRAKRMHRPIREQGAWLRSVVSGHVRYYGVPMNGPALRLFRRQVGWLWMRTLRRRGQRHRLTWTRMPRHVDHWLPAARVCHPDPLRRLGVIT